MATWDDVYFRNNLSDPGTYPQSGSSNCPDILPWGPEPQADPVNFFTNTYDQNFNRALTPNVRNYIYLRAKNIGSKSQSGHVNLYWSQASLLLYPSYWTKNSLHNESGNQDISFSGLAQNAIFVTEEPYIWTPSQISNDHYCMVSRVVTPDNPNPLPTESEISDVGGLANYVGQHPNVGWRNIALGDATGVIENTLAFSQGTQAGTTHIMISVQNAPGGSQVAFSTSKTGPEPPIVLSKTTVPEDNPNFQAGIYSEVPANFNAEIAYQYYSNGKPPTGDFSVKLTYFTFGTQDTFSSQVYEKSIDIRRLPLSFNDIDRMRVTYGNDIPVAFLLGQHTTVDSGVGFVANAMA